MSSASNSLLAFILMALGLQGVILSFLVPDRKKSLISLGLAGLIVLTGIIQLSSQSITRYRWNRRMEKIQNERRADLEELRDKLKQKSAETAPETPRKK